MTEDKKEYVSKYAKKHTIKVNEDKTDKESVNTTNDINHKFVKKNRFDIINKFPKHIANVALIVKDNAEIKRFTSIGILNYLSQKGEIKGTHKYVTFKWDRFVVNVDGFIREFSYSEPFFIKCLVASFTSFSASAQRVINIFCDKELKKQLNEVTTNEDIEEIVANTEKYQEDKNNSAINNNTDVETKVEAD